jgi:hypothetical protein
MYEGLGEVVAFIFGWTYMFLGKPLAAASITMVAASVPPRCPASHVQRIHRPKLLHGHEGEQCPRRFVRMDRGPNRIVDTRRYTTTADST